MSKQTLLLTLVLLLVSAEPANSQRISLGVAGGAALTDAFPDQISRVDLPSAAGIRTYSPFKDYLIGARVQVRLTGRWSLLADGLYRDMQGTWAVALNDGTLNSVSPSPVVTWEIPVMARYNLGGRRMQPFLEIGPSFRAIGNRNSNPSGHGVAGGAGVRLRAGWLDIAPQLRYTRWAADPEQRSRTGRNQIEALLALTTHTEMGNLEPFRGRISVGGTVGSNLADDYRPAAPFTSEYGSVTVMSQFQSGPRSVLGGPAVEVHAGPLSIDASFLRRNLHGTTKYQMSNGMSGSATSTVGVWEIPVMAKYRLGVPFRAARWRPLVEAGPAFHQGSYLRHFGAAAGAGVERQVRMFKITTGLRYTRWQVDAGQAPNEVTVLLGVRL